MVAVVAGLGPIAQRQDGTLVKWRRTGISLFADRHKPSCTLELVVDTEAHPLPVQGSPAAEQAVRRRYNWLAETNHKLRVSAPGCMGAGKLRRSQYALMHLLPAQSNCRGCMLES